MNGIGYDFIAVSEDFEYHDELANGMTNYNIGTYRGKVSNPFEKNNTDGLCFFWKKNGITATGETMVEFDEAYGGLDKRFPPLRGDRSRRCDGGCLYHSHEHIR